MKSVVILHALRSQAVKDFIYHSGRVNVYSEGYYKNRPAPYSYRKREIIRGKVTETYIWGDSRFYRVQIGTREYLYCEDELTFDKVHADLMEWFND
jgi:hypothetical protein